MNIIMNEKKLSVCEHIPDGVHTTNHQPPTTPYYPPHPPPTHHNLPLTHYHHPPLPTITLHYLPSTPTGWSRSRNPRTTHHHLLDGDKLSQLSSGHMYLNCCSLPNDNLNSTLKLNLSSCSTSVSVPFLHDSWIMK